MNYNHDFEVVIVGGGAAGLSAALVLGRARRRVAVIDAGEPRNAPAAHMQGFLSRDGMPPSELLAAGRAEVTGYGVEIINDRVVDIEPGFTVTLGNGHTLTARRILLATGVSDELPDIDGVWERWGKDLLHCPYCHGWEVRDQPLGVLGSSPARSNTHCWSANGPTMSSSSSTPTTSMPTNDANSTLAASASKKASSRSWSSKTTAFVASICRRSHHRAHRSVRPPRQRASQRRARCSPRV